MLRCSTTLACLACLTTALQHPPRRRRTIRRSNDEELSIDELERRERALSDNDGMDYFHPPDIHECARYRWSQDATHVKVEVPLPNRPSQTDVALVVGETSFDLSVVNADVTIRGQLAGEANPGRCGWDLFEDGGDGLIVRVAKRGNEDWDAFLVDEVYEPTASYKGVCEVAGASYEQTATEMRIEVALPDHVEARDVNVNVAADAWAVEAGAWSLGGELMGAVRADDTAWLVDDRVLFLTLTKRPAGTWWPGLTAR